MKHVSRRRLAPVLAATLVAATVAGRGASQNDEAKVSIHVDASTRRGPMTTMWAFFGHDEPNYTYMPDGQKLLSELAALSPVPVNVRVHNLLTTGDGTPALKWGSTNAYTEDANGRPVYDWTIIDRIFDTYVQRKMKPLVQIGFMPKALSVKPEPYQHNWAAGVQGRPLFTGWAYPPTDYVKWNELVYQWARHAVARYGINEVKTWYWEVWNEPDIGYWQGTPEEFQRLYDFAADGLKRALPDAKVGGPEVTGPNGARTQQILKDFLEHCLRGTNNATGKPGAPLDFITFHAKGAPRVFEGHVRMGISNQLKAISNGFQIVASYPELRNTPIVIGESDPEGCAACSMPGGCRDGWKCLVRIPTMPEAAPWSVRCRAASRSSHAPETTACCTSSMPGATRMSLWRRTTSSTSFSRRREDGDATLRLCCGGSRETSRRPHSAPTWCLRAISQEHRG